MLARSHAAQDDQRDVDAEEAADRQFLIERCFGPAKWIIHNQHPAVDDDEVPSDEAVYCSLQRLSTQELQLFFRGMYDQMVGVV